MSVLSTTGAASLKRSGFISSGNVLYNYYHIDVSGNIYGSDTMGGVKKLVKYDNASPVTVERINFIFAKDELIPGPYFGSYTGGKSWYAWAQPTIYGSGTDRGGLNGVGAYRSVDDSVVVGYVNWLGDTELNRGLSLISADGTVTTFNVFETGQNFYNFGGIVYSPALDAYFWYGANFNPTIRVYDGADPGTQIASGIIGTFEVYGMSVSSDGYPLVVHESGFPTVYTLRKITDTNLSYTSLGTITDSQRSGSTTFVWDASRSRYCKASVVSGQFTATLYFGYSSDGLTWTNVSVKSFNNGTYEGFIAITGVVVFLDGSDIYIQGRVLVSVGSDTGFQVVSSDGGSTWATGGADGYTLSTPRIIT